MLTHHTHPNAAPVGPGKLYHVYEGPNDWYVASEDAEGYHHQPDDGGNLTMQQATREAIRLNAPSVKPYTPCAWGCPESFRCSHPKQWA